jgi:hypothetical protein
MRHRAWFLTLSAPIALAIGSFAIVLPRALLAGKGVALPNEAAVVWVREVGVNVLAVGLVLFLVRRHADSPTLRALLIGNAALQLGLLPIEIAAFYDGVITRASGIVPNSVLHLVLATGFVVLAGGVRVPQSTVEQPQNTGVR